MRSLLLFVVAFAGPSAAILYNPSFAGGIGCAASGVLNTSSCPVTPTNTISPRQATNGAGVLCYDSAGHCNSNCLTKDCYSDVSTCVTGYASKYAANIWICPGDNALFTASSVPKGLPSGSGRYCFLSISDCETATNTTGKCTNDPATCSTGQAGPTPYNYIHISDSYSLSNGVPNGAGIFCFDNEMDCEASNNNPCGQAPLSPCVKDTTRCSTGIAGPLPVTFTCTDDFPPGSQPDGGGQLCYDTYDNCVGGPNACGPNAACSLDFATCSTGVAGPTSNNYYCPQDTNTSLPDGGGQLCYGSVTDCINGPNYCNDSSSCVTNYPTCGTGQVGPTPKNTFCSYDQPLTLPARPIVAGSLPNAAGENCYYSQADCLNGPNACFGATECAPDFVLCSTGQAGPTAAWNFCQKDLITGALPDGGGQLCYASAGGCFKGPNACGIDTPCGLDFTTCSTGEAGPTSDNWFCSLDDPVGIQSNNPALPAGSGLLCWDTAADCIAGPNACSQAAGDCVNNNMTLKICSTGMAAGNAIGNNFVCMKDIPTGAAANAAGKWCYDTLGDCINGTNACNSSAPCVSTPAAVCSTAASTNTFYCAYDYPYPANVTKGLTSLGNLCYKTALDCMNGPNPCNTSYLCQLDASLVGACKGASYQYFCPSSTQSGSISVPPPPPMVSAAVALPAARVLAVMLAAVAAFLAMRRF